MAIKLKSKEFYTAAETKQILGITDGTLYNYVDNGALERIIPPGKKQGVYRRSQVEQLARELKVFVATQKKIKSLFEKGTKEDVPDCARISQANFGAYYDVERQRAWMDKNPDIYYVIRNKEENNKIMGYVLMQPLKAEKIEKILREEEFSLEVETTEIETFEPGKPVHLYVASIAIDPSVTLTEKRMYAARLLSGFMRELINLGKKGIVFSTIVTRSDTKDGVHLMRNIGFTEIPSTTDKRNFIIEVGKSGIREIMSYKEALLESGVPAPYSLTEPYRIPEATSVAKSAKQKRGTAQQR